MYFRWKEINPKERIKNCELNFVLLEELKNNRNWRIRLGEYHLREIRIDAKKENKIKKDEKNIQMNKALKKKD